MNNKTGFGPVMGVDMIGRKLLSARDTGSIKKDKTRKVGMFYFIWNVSDSRQPPMDITKILKAHPEAAFDEKHPAWGKMPLAYHWGEPFWGYYFSNDEWVIRKHMEMLSLAGIDFLFFDTTNMECYSDTALIIMRVLHEYKQAGMSVPEVMFYTNTKSGERIQQIYDRIYKQGYYKDTWFYVDGKPAIVGRSEECSHETRDFFNVLQSQWPIEKKNPGGWPWIDFKRPQEVYAKEDGSQSIVNVSVAQHPQLKMGDSALYGDRGNWGRSYHHGIHQADMDENATLYGYNVQEQWENARVFDPDIVMVTGWNEWTAGKWDKPTPREGGRVVNFVDLASCEYSRDMDLMKGGYFDNYYMQLINDVRKYKGCEEIPCQKSVPIKLNNDFSQWDKVETSYKNFPGAIKRYAEGYGAIYINDTVRNNIIESKVTWDEENLYFYVRTATTMTPYFSGGSWMTLYINTTEEAGYNYIVNYCPVSEKVTSLAEANPEGFEGKIICEIPYVKAADKMHIQVPRRALGLEKKKISFQFKWADSTNKYMSVEDLYTNGNTAPLGRVNYIFENQE